ncbi:hypothetical protein [Streptomyces sp. NPDC001658]
MSAPETRPGTDPEDQPRYEPPPGVGKLVLWILLFLFAGIVVVVGGVYFG